MVCQPLRTISLSFSTFCSYSLHPNLFALLAFIMCKWYARRPLFLLTYCPRDIRHIQLPSKLQVFPWPSSFKSLEHFGIEIPLNFSRDVTKPSISGDRETNCTHTQHSRLRTWAHSQCNHCSGRRASSADSDWPKLNSTSKLISFVIISLVMISPTVKQRT